MGQDPGTGSARVSEPREPREVRDEIEATRREMGETVEALAAKTDVKAQAKQKARDTKDTLLAKKDELVGKAKQASPEGARGSALQLSGKARENALAAAAAAGFAAGFLAGRRRGR